MLLAIEIVACLIMAALIVYAVERLPVREASKKILLTAVILALAVWVAYIVLEQLGFIQRL